VLIPLLRSRKRIAILQTLQCARVASARVSVIARPRSLLVPATDAWFHEVKYDGYRMMVVRDGDRVRLISKGGHDYAKRFPWIVEAARKNRQSQFVIDGETVLLGVDGVPDFDGLHSGKHNDEVQFYAFDILTMGGNDLRRLPLSLRKQNLARLLARRSDGIFVAPFERGEIGPDLFRKAWSSIWKGWCRSTPRAPIARAAAHTGSRSRTRGIRPTGGCRISFEGATPMKFTEPRPYADPEVAARKIMELANAFEPQQDGRIYIEKINGPFLFELKGTPAEYKAGLDLAIAKGWLRLHESGTYVKVTEAGTALFA
jgi:bifunctional non-homologous end joining protein LigD